MLSYSLLLDGERWKQADVPAEIQSLVHTLESGMTLKEGSCNMSHSEGIELVTRNYNVLHVRNLVISANQILCDYKSA